MATFAPLLNTTRKLSAKETFSDSLPPRRSLALPLWSLLLFFYLTVSQVHAQTSSHLDFVYADRNALLADGWSFVAKSATGTARDTEQTGQAAVNYSQPAHPGVIRIPIGGGEIWQSLNNSKNTLFRPLPSDWISIRLKIAAFTPNTDYQQVALLAYQDDDNYLNVQRNFNSTAGGAVIGFFKEEGGVATRTDRRPLSNSGNLILRLDRAAATNTYTAFYSVDGGNNWIQLTGSPALVLNNPRLAIQVGANSTASLPAADLAWVEVIQSTPSGGPTINAVTPNSGSQGQSLTVEITGGNFASGAVCSFGEGVTGTCSDLSVTQMQAAVTIAANAPVGPRTVTITNPNGQSINALGGFSVTTFVPAPAPTVSALSPNSGSQGQNLITTISGANFQNGATCNFGSGITVTSCAFISPTELRANVTIAANTPTGTYPVTVTNPDNQSTSQANGLTVTPGSQAATSILTVAVLVNSSNVTGYNSSVAAPGEFQRYPQLYLNHLQVPYEVFDTAVMVPPANLGARQLIIAGHSGLNLSSMWQSAIVAAVNGGTGFVNLDAAPTVGNQTHIQSLFGAAGSTLGAPATSITVPAAVLSDGATPHFIAAWQRRFLGDPTGDIVYDFHEDQNGILQPVSPTVLSNAVGTIIARLGASPLVLARETGAGRVVHFGSYLYLKADRFGFLQGIDDLFWRSLVWAARKPFVLRGYPRYWSVQMDDTVPGWAGRVKDMYDTALTGVSSADGSGGPWKVTGYVFTDYFPAGSNERASVISAVKNGKLQVSPHSFENVTYGDMYWNTTVGPLTDGQWLANLNAIVAWKNGNGGSDAIPSFSRSMVAHFWDLSDNTGYDLWQTLGFRYITSVQKPGFQRPANASVVNVYNGAERLHVHKFWAYELPPKLAPSESSPFFFADDYTVHSRGGLPPQTFFSFATQYIDLDRFPRNDFVWPSATYNHSVAASIDQLQRYTWRHWSGLGPVQLFTHDVTNYEYASAADRRAVISQASSWLRTHGARHVFMESLGDYLYARTKSVLVGATQTSAGLQLTFTGDTVTADGAPVTTELLVFSQDSEGVAMSIPGFTGGTTVTRTSPAPLPTLTAVTPNSGSSYGGTTVKISGTNFVGVQEVSFGGMPASFVANSATELTVVTPPGIGVVNVLVRTASGSAIANNGYTYVTPPPASGVFPFTYPNRDALFAAGWNFFATTANGAVRNTEQTGALAVDYNQGAHPGAIRVPLGVGELWQGANSSQNTLFRTLPGDWTSIRLKVALFNPTADFQQVGLIAYQDDENYVSIRRNFNSANGGASIGTMQEKAGVGTVLERLPLSNTGNLLLRLDRNPATNIYTPYYSLTDGATWVKLKDIPAQVLNNARLAIQTGANVSGVPITTDLAWVEVVR